MGRHPQRTLPIFAVLSICLILKIGAAAEPSIEAVTPPMGQRGTTFEISVEGEGFDGVQDIVFYSPRIRCVDVNASSDYELKARIQADADCELTNQPFRILSRFGYSDLRTLRITAFPILPEAINAEKTRIENTDGTTCFGTLESGDIDEYEIELATGQRLAVEVEAVRLGYELLDTVLSISDPNGNVLIQVDDDPLFQQDPVASIIAKEPGVYSVKLHESNYQGGLTSHYALHVGSFPRPGVAFPAGGMFGQTLELSVLSPNGAQSHETVSLPGEDGHHLFALRPQSTGSPTPTSIPFRLSHLRSARDSEPNDAPETATFANSSPIAIDGILTHPGDIDCYRLTIPQTSSSTGCVRIEVFADRLGSPIDSFLSLTDSAGNFIASNDDWGSHDSRIEFAPTMDSEFILSISDKLGGGVANGVYRIEIRPVTASLTTFLPRPNRTTQQSQTIAVPRGNQVLKRVAVKREYIDGKVTLNFEDLPPGVHASPISISDDQFWGLAVLRADPAAELGGSLASLNASCLVKGKRVTGQFEQTIDLVHSTADQLFNSTTVDRVPVAVTPEVPFRVTILPTQSGLPSGGTLDLAVEVKREATFREPIRVSLPFLPPWVVAESHIVIPAGQTRGSFKLEARPEAQPRIWKLVASAKVDALTAEGEIANFEDRNVCSEPIELRIIPPPVRGRFDVLAGSRGGTIDAVCQLESTTEFMGQFTATLEGLPARVTAEPVTFNHDDSELVFQIQIAKDAPQGTFEGVQCRLQSTADDNQVSYVLAANTKLSVMEPSKLQRDAEGRLLSPLEALRQTQSNQTQSNRAK